MPEGDDTRETFTTEEDGGGGGESKVLIRIKNF
jgi:hypothetical protein